MAKLLEIKCYKCQTRIISKACNVSMGLLDTERYCRVVFLDIILSVLNSVFNLGAL
jgi:hypothetical protein